MTGFWLIGWSDAGSNRGPLAGNTLRNLAAEGVPGHAPQLAVVSMIALIYPFATQSVRRFLPGFLRQNEDPEAITRHGVGLLPNALD